MHTRSSALALTAALLYLLVTPATQAVDTAQLQHGSSSSRSSESLLVSALEVVSAPGTCGLSSSPLSTEGLLLNSTPPLVHPFLQAARDASQLLSSLPSLSEPNISPSVLGVLWRTLMNRAPIFPLGMAYFEAKQETAWILYNSELQPTRFSLSSNETLSTNVTESFTNQHGELAISLRKSSLINESFPTPIWSIPFWDCRLLAWVLAASFPVPGRGAMALLLPLQNVDINQCDARFSRFGGSHKCDEVTTTCVFLSGMGFQSGGYECQCLKGFFNPDATVGWDGFSGSDTEIEPQSCVTCPEECGDCQGGGAECMARLNPILRGSLLALESFCMGATVGLAFIVFRNRKRKPIATSMWTILETILLGTILLYATVVVRYFKPSIELCLLETWCRELGFVVCYGAIILKLYRILIEFRTRKAHRWVVRDKDLLKYLLAMVLIAIGYLAAHTATALHTMQVQPDALMAQGRTVEGIRFPACRALWWDFVTQTGEMGMLIFGMHLSYASRNAVSVFQERRFLCSALVVEAIVSGPFYVLRAVAWPHLHPDMAFVAYVARSQLSSTVVLLLLFLPKWWYCRQSGAPPPRLQPGPLLAEGGVPASPALGTCMDADLPEISLADMNPDDIRAELKRLYTQLEVLKNKTIRANNPHISKRRGGRKVAHRRFSLQKKGSREKALHQRQKSTKHHHHDHDGEGEVSRTPEDSVCSIEGPSAIYNDGPSVAYSELGYPASRK